MIEKLVGKRGQQYTQIKQILPEPKKRSCEKIMEAAQIEDDVETFESQDMLARDQIKQNAINNAGAVEV